MPRLTNAFPKYRKHRASGQAVVTIAGRDCYLGPHSTKASKLEYDRLINEWLASGRPSTPATSTTSDLTINELLVRYWTFAELHYQKDGKPTSEQDEIRQSLRVLKEWYGKTPVAEFGPLALKALRVKMIQSNLSRGVINNRIGKIKRVFRWAVSEQLAPASLMHALEAVMGLQKGRTKAREAEPVKPVDDATVQATLPHLSLVVADMIRFQRLTGSRPQDVCNLRPCDIDKTGDVWLYSPEHHKNEHHGKSRVIAIGPKAQDVLRPYLLRAEEACCFSPIESEKKRRETQHEERATPLSCGNRPGTNRTRKPKLSVGDAYDSHSYRRAIHRACDVAFPPPARLAQRPKETLAKWQARLTEKERKELAEWQAQHRWSPNRLRHSAATDIRKRYGLEAAQVVLGHASANITQTYAQRDLAKAVEVMREVG